MKLLYFTDPHIRANSPGSRKDDFPETILRKLTWVGDYAYENKIDAILVGGDWLDRPDISYAMLNCVIRLLFIWKTRGIRVFSILGNHDIYGYNPKTFGRTALSVLDGLDLITRLSMESHKFKCVSLTGADAHYSLDKNGCVDHYVDVPDAPGFVKIHLVHGFLTKTKWGDGVPSTTIADIAHTNANIVLTGHDHGGFGIIEMNGRTFCNPGAIARVTAGVGDINLEVKVTLIEVHEQTLSYKLTLIPLPADIARPAAEVLDREKLELEKENKRQLVAFTNSIGDFEKYEAIDIYSLLDALAEEEQISSIVISIARERLQMAEIQKGEHS